MIFQIPNFTTLAFMLLIIFFIGGMTFVSAYAVKVITQNMKDEFRNILRKRLILIMSIALWWQVFKQAISFKFIIFTKPEYELYINAVIGVFYCVLILLTQYKVMKTICDRSNTISLEKCTDE